MTVRLPSRIKEGNKRCRGRYMYAGTSCSFSGGGAGVPLPYRSRCVPSSASQDRIQWSLYLSCRGRGKLR